MARRTIQIRYDNRKLRRLIQRHPQRVQQFGDIVAEAIVGDIVQSFGTSPPGRRYERGNVMHVASQPNYPPNVDTGTLRASIRWKRERRFQWRVSDGVEYGVELEYGLRENLAPRPFMTPVFDDWKRRLGDFARRNLDLEDV